MKLYHGTSSELLAAILKEGIQPRSRSGNAGNWTGGWKSKPDFVYLTSAFPVYFASEAAAVHGGEMVVLEVDALKVGALYPDDEFVARVIAQCHPDVEVETVLPEIEPDTYEGLALDCLRYSGTVTCKSVPPSAISRHREMPDDPVMWEEMGGDAGPASDAYQAYGEKFREGVSVLMEHGAAAAKAWSYEKQRELIAAVEAADRAKTNGDDNYEEGGQG